MLLDRCRMLPDSLSRAITDPQPLLEALKHSLPRNVSNAAVSVSGCGCSVPARNRNAYLDLYLSAGHYLSGRSRCGMRVW